MRTPNEIPAIARSEIIYRSLLGIYPSSFRREYGAAMAQLFRDNCRDAYGREQMWGLTKTWLRAVLDLGKSACAEHISSMKGNDPMPNPSVPNRRRRWVAAAFLLVCAATWAVTWLQPRFYASTSRIALNNGPSKTRGDAQASTPADDVYFIQTELEKLQSKAVLFPIIDRFQLAKIWSDRAYMAGPFDRLRAYDLLKARMNIHRYRNSSMIEIQVIDEDKQLAANVANSIANDYIALQLDHLRAASTQGVDLLTQELKKADAKLDATKENLKRIRESENLSDDIADNGPPARDAEGIHSLESQSIEAETAYRQMVSLYDRLEHLDKAELANVLSIVSPDPPLNELLMLQAKTEQELETSAQDFGPGHPNVIAAKALFKGIHAKLNERVDGILVGLKFKVESLKLDAQLRHDSWQAALKNDAETARKYKAYAAVKRELEFDREMRNTYAAKLMQVKADALLQAPNVGEVIDHAEPGLNPVRPNLVRNFFVGILLGVVAGAATKLALILNGLRATKANATAA